MPEASTSTRLDVRAIPPHDRHSAIFLMFRALKPDESMEIVNDHDPKPLFHQFQAEAPGEFRWQYLDQGPQTWQVRITRQLAQPNDGQCCRACCGA